jgi:hypothetical protein
MTIDLANLPDKAVLTGTEQLIMNDGGVAKDTTPAAVADYVMSSKKAISAVVNGLGKTVGLSGLDGSNLSVLTMLRRLASDALYSNIRTRGGNGYPSECCGWRSFSAGWAIKPIFAHNLPKHVP